jgi:hypothetical protein
MGDRQQRATAEKKKAPDDSPGLKACAGWIGGIGEYGRPSSDARTTPEPRVGSSAQGGTRERLPRPSELHHVQGTEIHAGEAIPLCEGPRLRAATAPRPPPKSLACQRSVPPVTAGATIGPCPRSPQHLASPPISGGGNPALRRCSRTGASHLARGGGSETCGSCTSGAQRQSRPSSKCRRSIGTPAGSRCAGDDRRAPVQRWCDQTATTRSRRVP